MDTARSALLEEAAWDALALDGSVGPPRLSATRSPTTQRVRDFTLAPNPRFREARRLLSAVQYWTGELQAAIAALEVFVADAPDSTESADARAVIQRSRG